MANAIKKISVQRGYDVTEYLLNCFGGAAGQHACLVADALGMEAVLIHPFSGLCQPTASGWRRSSPRASRRCSSLGRSIHGGVDALIANLHGSVLEELQAQG